MNLSSLKAVVTSKVGRQLLHVQKHSPKIMFVAGVVGVVGTVVLASRATLKLDDVLEEHNKIKEQISFGLELGKNAYNDEDAKKDLLTLYSKTVLNIAKLYGPAVLLGIASIASLTGSHVVLSNRLTGVSAAYAALDKAFRTYQQRVAAEIGEEREAVLRHGSSEEREIVVETNEGPVVKTVKGRGHGKSPYARLFDEINSRNWSSEWQYNQMFLKSVQNMCNDKLRATGHLFLNEVYDALGLERTSAGAVVGWVMGGPEGHTGDGYVDFGIFDDRYEGTQFMNGSIRDVWLDFNVDGVIYQLIGE